MKKLIPLYVFMGLLTLSSLACDNGSGPIDKAWDCRQLCQEARDCLGGDDFDMDECTDSCRDDADDEAVDECENCLDNEDSCASQATCTAECAEVLTSTVFD
jgi:hypothetical protein